MLKSPVSFCPVPDEQQPLNEYQQLKESWLFRWTLLPPLTYLRKLLWVWGFGGVITGPIAAASFPPLQTPLHFILAAGGGALGFVLLILLRLYLGWFYIRDRLSQEQVEYEESGWYDGQIWEKPAEVLTRDRLVVTYQVQPLLKRLRNSFLALLLLLLLGSLCWFIPE
ncbi:CGLD27 family protein [Spirulina sp. CS-785/01]|uniref:CGLD27 family protein n=1 Tax=Spirulina sp. CS-785/01 TaxID=3021716 RepID=UPI002330ECBE|nr:CGLD27 family protein [Spirulina sp. CS-785/01]MDB9313253.1 CGLD27 family protein [Spirulina sp. CS-785/01]